MIDDATLRRMEAENIACGDTENEWIIRTARRYLALREHGILLRQEAVVFDVTNLDAAGQRLLENES